MTSVVFRPNFVIGIFALALAILVAAQIFIVVTLGSVWLALLVCLPFLAVCVLCLFALCRAWRERVELTNNSIIYAENAERHALRSDNVASIRVSRWEAFDAQAPIVLVLETRDESAAVEWNLANFGLKTNLRIAVELARRAGVPCVTVSLHQGREKELRALTKKLGVLMPLARKEPQTENYLSCFATFLLTPHR